MAKKNVDLKYAPGVPPAPEGPLSPEVAESLKGPRKVRITTMVDLDVYDALKKMAGDRGYQTLLNNILKQYVLGDDDEGFRTRVLSILSQGEGKQMILNLLGSVAAQKQSSRKRKKTAAQK